MKPLIDILVGYISDFRVTEFMKLWENQTFKDFRMILLVPETSELEELPVTFDYSIVKEKNKNWHPEIKHMRHAIFRNELLDYAIAEFILLFDSWQIPANNLLEEHIRYLKRNYNVCGSRIECSNPIETFSLKDNLIISKKDPRNSGFLKKCPPGEHWDCNSSCKTEILKNSINGWDLRFAGNPGKNGGEEDCDKGIRLFRSGERFIYNPKALMWHLNHDTFKRTSSGQNEMEEHYHQTFKFRNSDAWDPSSSGDDNLMEDKILRCWYDKYNIKRWTCKLCEESGLVDSKHVLFWNEENNIIRTPCGYKELNL